MKVYASYNINQNTRLNSSSGGIFFLLAKYILSKNGVVYGVKMSEDCYLAEFTRVTDIDKLIYLQGSKYLQAKVGDTFKQVKRDLQSGKYVLFSGTGCEVNGLKCFLGKDYDNLLCIDVICHGVPSPLLWKKYAQYQEQINHGKLKDINFRCKDSSLSDFKKKETFSNIPQKELRQLFIPKDEDSYMRMFLRDYCLRPSCYDCMAKKGKMSDITMGDFWGINNVAPEMNDGRGTSLIIIRTDKGNDFWKCISSNLKLKEVSYENAVRYNPSEYMSCQKTQEKNDFFKDMKIMTFQELEKKYASLEKEPLRTRTKRQIKSALKMFLKFFINTYRNNKMDYGLFFVFYENHK